MNKLQKFLTSLLMIFNSFFGQNNTKNLNIVTYNKKANITPTTTNVIQYLHYYKPHYTENSDEGNYATSLNNYNFVQSLNQGMIIKGNNSTNTRAFTTQSSPQARTYNYYYATGAFVYRYNENSETKFSKLNDIIKGTLSYLNEQGNYSSIGLTTINNISALAYNTKTATYESFNNINKTTLSIRFTTTNGNNSSLLSNITLIVIPYIFASDELLGNSTIAQIGATIQTLQEELLTDLQAGYELGAKTSQTLYYEDGYKQGYNIGLEEGKTQGIQEGKTQGETTGYNKGYNVGYQDGINSNETPSSTILNLFGAITSVPINILNGLSDLAFWQVSIIGIIATLLFFALLLWLIRKFI